MTILNRKGITAGTVAGISVAMIAGIGAVAAKADSAKQTDASGGVSIRSIVVFPIANNAGTGADDISSKIDDAVRLRLDSVNKFKVTRFSRLLPTVQRGLEDKELTEQDVVAPFGDDDKDQPRAAKIAQRMDVDSYFVGNLDSYKADATTKTVTIQVTGTLYFTQTGGSAKTVGASVTEKPQNASDDMSTVIQAAVNDAAGQIASGINGLQVAPPPVVAKPTVHRQSLNGGGLLIAIAAGALIYAATHHDNSSSPASSGTGGTGGTDGPPAPPL